MTTKRVLLAIMGGGNMAKAIMLGALDAKLLAPFEVAVCEPDAAKRAHIARWGVLTFSDHREALDTLARADPIHGGRGQSSWGERGGQVLLAVKPQMLGELAGQLGPALRERAASTGQMPVVISILAGTPMAKVQAMLQSGCLGGAALGSATQGAPSVADAKPSTTAPAPDFIPVIRAMPNTPARLRKGMTALAAAPGVAPEDAQFAYDLFVTLGEVVKINEELMDAFTALSGSGPAYIFYLAEAMVRAAQEVGFDRITSDRVVRQTIAGAAALLAESHEPPEALRAAVTSKGGTTEAAVEELERSKVIDAVVRAIVAGRDRGRLLAK